MRTKSKAYDLPDNIDEDIIFISTRGCIFSLDRVSDKLVPPPRADNSRAHLLKIRASKDERRKARLQPPTKRVAQYGVIQYWKGARMGSVNLFMTIDQLRKDKVKMLKLPWIKKRIKGSMSDRSLESLTGARTFVK